jgi:hypothetical protein
MDSLPWKSSENVTLLFQGKESIFLLPTGAQHCCAFVYVCPLYLASCSFFVYVHVRERERERERETEIIEQMS